MLMPEAANRGTPDASSTRRPSSAISHTPSPPIAFGGVSRRLRWQHAA